MVGARRRLRTGPLHTFSLVLAPSPHGWLSSPPAPPRCVWMRGQTWGSEGLAPHHAAPVGTRSWPRSHRPGRAACSLFPCREATWGSCEHDPAECAQETLEAPPTRAGPGLPRQISAGGGSPATGGSERPFTPPPRSHQHHQWHLEGTHTRAPRSHTQPSGRGLGSLGNPSASPTDPRARER